MAIVQSIKPVTRAPVTFREIKQWYEDNLAPGSVNLNDQHVYENVYHAGKWAGIFQCVDEGTQVSLASGDHVRIDAISVGDQVACFDRNGVAVNSGVTAVFDQGMRDCIELSFDDGVKLICTSDHPIMTQRGWVPAGELTEADDVVSFTAP